MMPDPSNSRAIPVSYRACFLVLLGLPAFIVMPNKIARGKNMLLGGAHLKFYSLDSMRHDVLGVKDN
jgi:hypothetical protein